jgi:hypothetical protein
MFRTVSNVVRSSRRMIVAKQSKSVMILEYMKANPDAMPTEVAQALSKPKAKITPQYVSFVKSKERTKAKGKRKAKKDPPHLALAHLENGNGQPPAVDKDLVGIIVQTKTLADRCGGMGELRRLVDTMAEAGVK